jgi:hypothetical protein
MSAPGLRASSEERFMSSAPGLPTELHQPRNGTCGDDTALVSICFVSQAHGWVELLAVQVHVHISVVLSRTQSGVTSIHGRVMAGRYTSLVFVSSSHVFSSCVSFVPVAAFTCSAW